jgi:hypothetical protein
LLFQLPLPVEFGGLRSERTDAAFEFQAEFLSLPIRSAICEHRDKLVDIGVSLHILRTLHLFSGSLVTVVVGQRAKRAYIVLMPSQTEEETVS